MTLRITTLVVGLFSVAIVGCATTVGATDPASTPTEAAQTCEAQCEALGLEMDAIALHKRDVSCICEPDD
jgi:hypothetical protein